MSSAPPVARPLRQLPAVLSIAGSDPSGGAGIQADLKTLALLGVYGAAAVTCLTAQNTLGVSSLLPVPADFVAAQVRLVLDDLDVTHIKTGMIGTGPVAAALAPLLADFPGEIVCDPVIRATDGHALLEGADLSALADNLLAQATVITPNRPELEMLSGLPCPDREAALEAAASLFERFQGLRAIVVKGGHIEEQATTVIDTLLLRGSGTAGPEAVAASHLRRPTGNTHGTGCTLAAAFAAYHLRTGDYRQAFELSVAFVDRLLALGAEARVGQGRGPLLHHLWVAP